MPTRMERQIMRFEELDSKTNVCRVAFITTVLTVFFVMIAVMTRQYGFLYLAMICFCIAFIYCLGMYDLMISDDEDNDV